MLKRDGPTVVKSRLTKEQRELRWWLNDKKRRSKVRWGGGMERLLHDYDRVTFIGGKTYYG